jgi:ribosomal protein S12 methylthiotransferase
MKQKKSKHKTPPPVYVVSLGCPKNLIDTEGAMGMLDGVGVPLTGDIEEAGAILVNTCGFTRQATEESLDVIRELAAQKNAGRKKKLLVFGCLMERDGQSILQAVPEIDAIFGVNPGMPLGKWLLEQLDESSQLPKLEKCGPQRLLATPPHTAYLRVADGCDHTCGFCVIPSFRGKLKSRPIEEIVEEANTLAANGALELTLIAQDTSAYGSDLYGSPMLAELLRQLDMIVSLHWIRLHYLYPATVTDELIETMASAKRVVPYLDIPFQHCDAGVLSKMRRGGNEKMLEGLVERFRAALPGLVLRTAFIVGHPGEGEAEFATLLDFVERIQPDRTGVFRFSPEEGSHSATLEGIAPADVMEERFAKLAQLTTDICERKNQALVGERMALLVDGESNIYPDHVRARWYGQSPDVDGVVYYPADGVQPGQFVAGEIVAVRDVDLFAAPFEVC